MKMFLCIIYFYFVSCIGLPLNSTASEPNILFSDQPHNPFKTEVSPHIRHRQNKKPKDINSGFPFYSNFKYCQRTATCLPLYNRTCMGAKLPYHSSSLDLTDIKSLDKVQELLHLYKYFLRYIPKCWAVIQPFLCALYMPKCDNDQVDLPSREMCRITLEPCKIFYQRSVLPDFLNCNDTRLFPTTCKNDIHDVKFNTTGLCMDPLIVTDKPEWWYPDIEGCGLKCKDSFYTDNEHYQIHKLIIYGILLCTFLHVFTITTFIIDWKTAKKYPALAIFYVNICFSVSCGGWLVQYFGAETREDVVCNKDGTLRKSEPSASENLSCVIVFVMVYYFMIAGMVWFVIFSYAWYMSSLQALGKILIPFKKYLYVHILLCRYFYIYDE